MKELMIKAHKIAKTLEGNYQARLSIALKIVWAQKKSTKKAVVVKETTKAKMLVLFFEDILGEEREVKAWFPNGWLEENNIPKMWALNKKIQEVRAMHQSWDLHIKRVLVA